MQLSLNPELQTILESIENAGGTILFIGGFVRDLLLGEQSKDIDIEVYKLDAKSLIETLEPFGRVEQVGASFAVIKLSTQTQDYDFALPRRENKTSQGYKGFTIEADPNMTPKEAASRRDFSINAIAVNRSGKILDYYGGQEDLKNKRLKHVSTKFAEDPLRVLRAFQFAARFNFSLDPETAKLAQSLKNEYSSLSQERIWTEWQKWAAKATKPSQGLNVLLETGWLEFYPELSVLLGIPQEPQWHPEGDVWTHTKYVLDEAAAIATRENLNEENRVILLFAALCHDLGKATTTIKEDNCWKSPRHAEEGVPLSESLLKKIHAPQSIIQHVKPLVKDHMNHLNQQSPKSIRRLAIRLEPSNINMLTLLIEADASGRPPLKKGLPESAKKMLELAESLELKHESPKPILLGRHLIDLAKDQALPEHYLKGGPHFSELLEQVFQKQLDGDVKSLEEAKLEASKLSSKP